MDLTLVIVNWNGGDLLLRCLRTVQASRTTFAVKVIVVDNDSSDGSREEATKAFPAFNVINSGGNIGFGRANNLVREIVDTPLVLFLNPDTELREDTLERAVHCLLDHPDVGILGCKMLYPTGEVQQLGLQWFPSPRTILLELLVANRFGRRWFGRWLPTMDPMESTYLHKLYGGFMLTRKEILDRAGWFDDRYFMYAEDVDLSRTITDLGWKLYYCSEAEIVHVAGGTSAQAPSGFSTLMKLESISKLMQKYHGPTGAVLYRCVVLLGAAVRLVIQLPLRLVPSRVAGNRSRRWDISFLNSKLMILWACGIEKPVVKASPPQSESTASPVQP